MSSAINNNCGYCGSFIHKGVCPTVKALEYHPDGTIKRVEFKTAKDYPLTTLPSIPPIACTSKVIGGADNLKDFINLVGTNGARQ